MFSKDKNFCSWGHLTDNDQQHPHEGQEGDVKRAAERHAGDDEGDDEHEEADDHQSGDGFGPGCRRYQREKNVFKGKNGPRFTLYPLINSVFHTHLQQLIRVFICSTIFLVYFTFLKGQR